MHELFPEYEIVWALGKDSSSYSMIPKYVRVIPNKGLKRLNAMARTFAYVTNEANESNVYKKEINLLFKHGMGIAFLKRLSMMLGKMENVRFQLLMAR